MRSCMRRLAVERGCRVTGAAAPLLCAAAAAWHPSWRRA